MLGRRYIILWANFVRDIVVCLLLGGGEAFGIRGDIFGRIFISYHTCTVFAFIRALGIYRIILFFGQDYKHELDICTVEEEMVKGRGEIPGFRRPGEILAGMYEMHYLYQFG